MSKTKEESCSPEIGNTEESRENSSDVEALQRWTNFEEVENIIGPYVSQAIHKAVYGGYKSAQEVYVDYTIFNHALTQLVAGQDKLLFERCDAEYSYHYALWFKKEMLHRFSAMLPYASLKDIDEDWIKSQLEEDKKSGHLLLDIAKLNNYWELNLDKGDLSELIRQKKEKLETIYHSRKEFFQDVNFSERKKEFEALKCYISCTYSKLKLLTERAPVYYKTLADVEDVMPASMLAKEFQRLLHKDEKELSSKWWEETARRVKVVLKEKEKSDKAQDICDANWNKFVASSGLV